MKWFHKCVVFALLAIWLPVTQHCDLEAAGLLAAHDDVHAAETDCCEPTTPCSHDGCEVVENGTYLPADNVVKVLTPDLFVCTCFLFARFDAFDAPVSDEPDLPDVAAMRPQAWVPTWHFARRAAPLSRAPSVLG